ncbi:MAG: hypothetical protein C5B54_09690, partial [Acidobacteria bacterium]
MKRFFHISRKVIRWIVVVVGIIVVSLAMFLNSNYFDSLIRNLIQTKLGKPINREITVDSVDFNPFKLDILLKNFRLGNDPRGPKEVPFFRADEIYARVSWRYLFGGKIRIDQVRLVRPELHVIMYESGGNNIPKSNSTKPKSKKGLDLIVNHVDCENMLIQFNQRRVPLSFSVNELQTYAEYDYKQKNYAVNTSFKDGFLKITHFNVFKFDLKADYRVIGDRVTFEKLYVLSAKSKFYFAGEMYNLSEPFFDMHFRSHIDLTQAKQMFDLPPEMEGSGNFRATYSGTFAKFRMQGSGNFNNFTFYSLPIDNATFDLDMTDNWLKVTNIQARMFDGSYKGDFTIDPLKGAGATFKTSAEFKDWDGKKLCKLIRMNDMNFPVKGSGKASLTWGKEGGIKDSTGDFSFKLEPYQSVLFDLTNEAEKTKFDNALFQNTYLLPFYNETHFHMEHRQLQNLVSHLKTPNTTADFKGMIDFSGKANIDLSAHCEKIPEVDLLFHYLQSYFKARPARLQEFWGVTGSADFQGKLDETVWGPFEPRIAGNINGRNVTFHSVPMQQVTGSVQFYGKRIDIFDSRMVDGKATAHAQATFLLGDKEEGTTDRMELTGGVQNYPAIQIVHA